MKEPVAQIKLQIPGGQANPAPPIGPALGQHGVNIMDFCKQYNAQTENMIGFVVTSVISSMVRKAGKLPFQWSHGC